jgi:hypothetical protein
MRFSMRAILMRLDVGLVLVYLASYFAGLGWLHWCADILSISAPLIWTSLLFFAAIVGSWTRRRVLSAPPDHRRGVIFVELLVFAMVALVAVRFVTTPETSLHPEIIGFFPYLVSVVVVFGAGALTTDLGYRLFCAVKGRE